MTHDMPDSRLEEAEALQRREIARAWDGLLAQEAGRLILWSILEKCHLYSTTFTGDTGGAFMEGERSVGLKILQEHVFPNGMAAFTAMMTEAEQRAERLAAAVRIEESEGDDEN